MVPAPQSVYACAAQQSATYGSTPLSTGDPDTRTAAGGQLRVCAWPGPSIRPDNPYTWLVHAPMAELGVRLSEYRRWSLGSLACDVLHVHWPESAFWGRIAGSGLVAKVLCARLVLWQIDRVRSRGGILAWTAHNIEPHMEMDGRTIRIWRRFFRSFCERVDLVLSLTRSAQTQLLDAYPDLRGRVHAVLPHPHYRTAYPPPVPRTTARLRLQLPTTGRILCSLGFMRPNKGLDELIEVFRACAAADDLLVLGGACEAPYLSRLEQLRDGDARIRLLPRRLDEETMATILAASDGFVLNHRRILNSGSLLLALSFNQRVLVRAQGSVMELAAEVGRNWVETFDGPLDEETLRRFLDSLDAGAGPGIVPLDHLEPARIAAATVEQYRLALAARGHAAS